MTAIRTFTVKTEDLPLKSEEILRYLGYKRASISDQDLALAAEAAEELRPVLSGRGCCCRFPVSIADQGRITMPYGEIVSRDLSRNLQGCREIFLIAVTIGSEFDRALRRAEKISMAKAALYQAVGATAVEDVIDRMNAILAEEVSLESCRLRPRYSPGFGDFRLEQQRGIFAVLHPEKHAGITLRDTLVMAPEKSVTAIIGIEKPENYRI